MKNILLGIFLVIAFNTCKKENIEEELPELIGNWQFYGASYNNSCTYRVFNYYSNHDFSDPNLIILDNTFKLEITKRKINFNYLGKKYQASINEGSIKKSEILEYIYFNNSIVAYCDNNMNYIPNIGEIKNGDENNIIEVNLNYKRDKFSDLSNQLVLKKITILDNNGLQKEFLQMFIYDIKGTILIKKTPLTYEGLYACGTYSPVILTFEKL